VNHDQQQQAERIDQDMSFAPKGLLAGIEAALGAATIRSLDRLVVEDRRCWLPFAPFLFWRQVSQAVVNPLPDPSVAPSAKVAVNGLPWRVLAGQIAPLATCAVDVKDGVNGQAHIGLTIPFAGFRGGYQGFDIPPFSVGKIAWVELVAHPDKRL
jgi:hypothetical protein